MTQTDWLIGAGLLLAVGVQAGALLYVLNKGISFGQPKGEGFAPGWVVRCLKCNRTVDAGKAGLIRIKATGESNRRGWCDGCHKKVWLRVEILAVSRYTFLS
jgi:hypothetical protein